MKNKNGNVILRNVVIFFTIVFLCIGTFSGCVRSSVDVEKGIYVKKDDVHNTEFIESKFVGDVISKTFCDMKITAAYDKTIHKPIGDITESRYRITSIERDGVTENVSENDYISFDTKGNVIGFSSRILPGKIKCERVDKTYVLELADGTKYLEDYGHFDSETTKELREAVEKILGDIVDWSQYNQFEANFDCPSYLDFYVFPYTVYNYVTFTWTQGKKPGYEKRRTDSVVSCKLEFATVDLDGGGHIFFDEAYFSDIVINNPFVEKKPPARYIENEDFGVKLSNGRLTPFRYELEKNGYDVTNEGMYFSVYNEKLCWIIELEAWKDRKTTKYFSIYPI